MAWFVALVVGVLLFAVLFDVAARLLGRYRPAAEWEEAHRRRKSRQWRPRYEQLREGRDPERHRRAERERDGFNGS